MKAAGRSSARIRERSPDRRFTRLRHARAMRDPLGEGILLPCDCGEDLFHQLSKFKRIGKVSITENCIKHRIDVLTRKAKS